MSIKIKSVELQIVERRDVEVEHTVDELLEMFPYPRMNVVHGLCLAVKELEQQRDEAQAEVERLRSRVRQLEEALREKEGAR